MMSISRAATRLIAALAIGVGAGAFACRHTSLFLESDAWPQSSSLLGM